MELDAAKEFEEPTEPVEPEPEPKEDKPVESVTREELAQLRAEYEERLATLQKDASVAKQLREIFTKSSDPRDELVRKEIKRLVPELDDIDKIKELLPEILKGVVSTSEERLAERVGEAQEVTRSLMKDIGLDGSDDEALGFIEEALSREIKSNPDLMRAWTRGNVKQSVTKAFEKVQAKLFAPVRAKAKGTAVRTMTEAPKATPPGGPPSPKPAAPAKFDPKDTTRQGVAKTHDAAFERLQELLNQE